MIGGIILTISIVFSSFLFILFKGFEKYSIKSHIAIVINYYVAATLSFVVQNELPNVSLYYNANWGWAAFVIGFFFIVFFNLMAFSSQKIGITQTTVANKTTFIFPVIMGMTIFNEPTTWIKIIGLVCAFVAVYFSAKNKTERASIKTSNITIILLLFFGGGVLDALISYSQTRLVPSTHYSLFTGYIFLTAAVFGSLHLLYQSFKSGIKLNSATLIGGSLLGLANYGSIYFFLTAMGYDGIGSSIAFPVSNMGIIVMASFLGAIFFKEQITLSKKWAILFAVVSIILVGII